MLVGMDHTANIPEAVPKASSDPLPEISSFLEPFAPLFRRSQSRHSLERYITGLLTDLDRKNCDTIAAAVAGTSTERLQHLLTDADWDSLELDGARVRSLSHNSAQGGGILVLDETSFPKKGKSSVGVARQYCGALGKRANCQVVVSAEYVADELESSRPLHWPVCAQLYLPEEWAKDRRRRERAHVPEEVGFRSKPQIALSVVDLSGEWGVPFGVVADCGYGKYPTFLEGLEDRKLPYVSGVESTFGVRLPEEVRAAKEDGAPPYRGRGRPPKERPAPLYTAKELIGSLPEQAWQTVAWREGTKGALSKEMVAVRAHRATGSDRHSTTHERVVTAEEGWLIAQRPLRRSEKREDLPGEEEELKYYYSSLGADVSLERLAALAKSRWAIEQFYEDAKGECGLSDYQGRRWEGLHRHLALSMVAYSFLMVHSSVLLREDPSQEEEETFSPLQSGKAHDAASDSQAGTGVVAGGSGAVVRRNREDKNLSSS
jgi:SRSO17 transposase